MPKISKIIFSFFILANFFWPVLGLAQSGQLIVEFEQRPLFSQANFLPGQSVSRFVKVANQSSISQRIAVSAINISDVDRLGDVLDLTIKQGGLTIYHNVLSKFFESGENYLSDLAGNGGGAQYDFVVSFYPKAADSFQGKMLSFDILIGFQGQEGGILPGAGSSSGYPSGGGGGSGGGQLPVGLSIFDSSVMALDISTSTATIVWTTSYPSTSQVIYAQKGTSEKHILDLTDTSVVPPFPPRYGYAQTTLEYDISPKTTEHKVIVSGLIPGAEYYFRSVSHASLAIGREYSFITKSFPMTINGIVVNQANKNSQIIKNELTDKLTDDQAIVFAHKEQIKGLVQPFVATTSLAIGLAKKDNKSRFLATMAGFLPSLPFNKWFWLLLIVVAIILACFHWRKKLFGLLTKRS